MLIDCGKARGAQDTNASFHPHSEESELAGFTTDDEQQQRSTRAVPAWRQQKLMRMFVGGCEAAHKPGVTYSFRDR
jgi:hypothetical protein